MIIYIYGNTWIGKTHWAFDGSELCIDTSDDNSKLINKLTGKKTYSVLENIDTRFELEDINTIAIDTLYGLKDIAKQKYLKENNKKIVFPIPDWGIVYGYMQDFISQFEDRIIIITTRKKPMYGRGEHKNEIVGDAIDVPDIFEYRADIMLHMKLVGDKRMFGVYKDRYQDPLDCAGKQLEVLPLKETLEILV